MITPKTAINALRIVTVTLLIILCRARAAIIAPDGRPYNQILLQENAPGSVELAAKELQSFLKQMTGTELPIVHQPTAFPLICLGSHPLLESVALSHKKLPSEGWAYETTEDFLAIYGDDYDGPPKEGIGGPWSLRGYYNQNLDVNACCATGTLTGVYEFLHRVAGFRFYMPGKDGTVIPEMKEFNVPKLKQQGAPAVPYRHPSISRLSLNDEEMLWAKRMSFGGRSPVGIVHYFWFMDKYRDTHPEYYALVDGKRDFGGSKLCAVDGQAHYCLTNKGLIEQYAKEICKWFDNNPHLEVFPLAPGDGLQRICGCPDCQAELHADYPEQEQFSYHIWNFVRKVGAIVGKTHPDKYVGCLAYERYRTPPRELGRMKNVAVMFTVGRCSLVNPESQKKFHAMVDEWKDRVDRFYLWDWYLNHWPPWNNLPVIFLHAIQDDVTWLLSHPKYLGEFIECEAYHLSQQEGKYMEFPGLQHLGLYLTGRMYMDPATNADDMLREYARLFYGPAEKPMLAFWKRAEERYKECFGQTARSEKTIWNPKGLSPEEVFNLDVLNELQGYIDNAFESTEEGSVHRRRVAIVKGEFDKGHERIIGLVNVGKRQGKLAFVNNFDELQKQKKETFRGKDGGKPDTPKTTIRYGRDRRNLYFRIICDEPDVKSIVANVKEADNSAIWKDDSIDIYLYPDSEKFSKGYHIIANLPRAIYDSTTTKGSLEDDVSWQSNAHVDTRHEAGCWIMDITIPFASLGIADPEFAGPIAANFYRNRYRDGKVGCSCWNPTGMHIYNEPHKFGQLIP